eukprot:gene58263-biopygen98237
MMTRVPGVEARRRRDERRRHGVGRNPPRAFATARVRCFVATLVRGRCVHVRKDNTPAPPGAPLTPIPIIQFIQRNWSAVSMSRCPPLLRPRSAAPFSAAAMRTVPAVAVPLWLLPLVAWVTAAQPSVAPSQDPIVNGGFESPPAAGLGIAQTRNIITGWTLSSVPSAGGQYSITTNHGAWGNVPSTEGVVFVGLHFDGAFVEQSVTFGSDPCYVLGYDMKYRPGYASTQCTVLVDGQTADTFTASSSWETRTITVHASAATIRFQNTGGTGDHTLFLDNVTLQGSCPTNAPAAPSYEYASIVVMVQVIRMLTIASPNFQG